MPLPRYPDVIVHRMLRSIIASKPDTDSELGSVDDLTMTANRCNAMKAAAKKVSEASSEIFFSLYVKQCGPIEETGEKKEGRITLVDMHPGKTLRKYFSLRGSAVGTE